MGTLKTQFAWSFAAHAASLLLPPILLLILARLLTPTDFGIFAIVVLVVTAVQALSLGPLGEVVVRSEREDIGHFIFTAQMAIGLVLAIALFATAHLIGSALSQPEAGSALQVSALLLLVTPLGNTAISMSMRQMAFKAVFVRRVVSPLANALLAIPLALAGAGYWALVWGQIFGFAAATAVVITIGDWRPRFTIDLRRFGNDIFFTKHMIIQSIGRWVLYHSDRAFLSGHVSLEQLGQYDIARRLAGLPFAALVDPVVQVLYALLSDQARRGADIQAFFLRAQRRVLMIALPLSGILAFNSDVIVILLLGVDWLPASPIFTIMVLTVALSSVFGLNALVFKVFGSPGVMTRFVFARAVISIPIFVILAPYGVIALSCGMLGLTCLFSPISVVITMRCLGVSLSEYASSVLVRPLLVAGAVGLTNLAATQVGLTIVPAAAIGMMLGGLLMLAAVYRWERDVLVWIRA